MKSFWQKLTGRPGQAWDWLRAIVRRSWTAIRQMLTGTTTRAISTLVAVSIIIAIPLLIFVPKCQVAGLEDNATRLEREDNARRTLAQMGGGAIGLVVIWITWRRLQVAQEGQVTERFSRSIEHLGNKQSLDVRLGGIYALERIARDSRQDHWPVMEILTAYVREHAPWKPPSEDQQPVDDEPRPAPLRGPGSGDDDEPPRLATDIQAVLTILGRRQANYDPPGQRLDLRNTDLHGADLDKANLQGARLAQVNLLRAELREANLRGTHLNEAILRGAILGESRLQRAILWEAQLQGAILIEAKLQGARLAGAYLHQVDLSEAIGLTSEQLAMALGDDTTKLPPGVERPSHWPA